MKNLKSLISIWVVISYFFLSLTGVGNDVLCVHESGQTGFESIFSNDCIDIFSYIQEINQSKTEIKKTTFNDSNDYDHCHDLLLTKNIITYSKNVISENDLALKYFFIIKYLSFLEENNNKNINDSYFIKPNKSSIPKLAKLNIKKTIVLLI